MVLVDLPEVAYRVEKSNCLHFMTTGVTDSVSVVCVSWEDRLGDQFSLLAPKTLNQSYCAVHSVYPLACTEYLCSDGTARSTETGRKAFLMFPSLQVGH